MDLFIPYIATVEPAAPVADSKNSILNYSNLSVPAQNSFQKVYFEELARKCWLAFIMKNITVQEAQELKGGNFIFFNTV